MKLSLSLTNYSWQGDLVTALGDVARRADEGGLDTLWVADHLLQVDPFAPPDDTEMLEAYTTLGYLAARTERIRLGTMVTGVTFRPSSLLVKAVTTLDVLSGGRAWLGVGTGHAEAEAAAMGLPFPPTAERFEYLESTVQLALAMWTPGTEQTTSPLPASSPHPSLLIAGMGEKKTLRMVAQYAQACNLPDIPDGGETIQRKLAVLAQHCERLGTSFDAIDKTLSTRLEPGESVQSFVSRSARARELGMTHMTVIAAGAWSPDGVDTLVAAAPELEKL